MNDATTRIIIGISFLIVGAILLLVSLSWFWDGWHRWSGIANLNESRRVLFLGRERAADERAQAAARYRKHPATAVASFNPRSESAERDLSAIAAGLTQQQNQLRLVQDYLAIINERPVSISGSGINSELLRTIQDYQNHRSGSTPPLPQPRPGESMDPALLQRAMEWQLRAAWTSGDQQTLSKAGGQFALLFPRHPAAPYARLLHAATSSSFQAGVAARLARQRDVPDGAVTAAILRAGGHIRPDNNAALQDLIPNAMRTGVELIATMMSNRAPPANLVSEAIKTRNDNILRTVASYCLEIDRLDLIRQLGRHGSEEFQRMMAIVIAQRELDFATLKRLNIDTEALRPQAMLLHTSDNWLSFHVGDSFGRVPSAVMTVTFGGDVIAPDSIQRLGSLYHIPVTRRGRLALQLRRGDEILYSQEVVR